MSLTVGPAELVRRAEASGSPGLLARHPSWSRVAVGDIAQITNGFAFSSKQFNSQGRGVPLIRIRDVGKNETGTYYTGSYDRAYLVDSGDLLVGMDGDFRVDIWYGVSGLLNQRVCKLSVDERYFDKRFLRHILQGYLDTIWQATSSVTVKHLSSRTIAEIPVPLPSLAEQRRIVEALEDHLSRLDAGQRSLGRIKTRLTSAQRSVMDFTAYATATSSDPAPRPTPCGVDDGELPRIPKSWQWDRLGDFAEVVGGVTKDAKRQGDPDYVEVPYLRVANVQRGKLDLEKIESIRVPPKKADQLKLRYGDVLLNEGGDRDKLGRGWIWEEQIEDMIHQNHVFRARILGNRLDPRLLAWHANSFGRRWFDVNGKQSVNLASISLSKIRKFPVPIPPREEQQNLVAEIEKYLSIYEAAQRTVDFSIRRVSFLRRSLLSQAFEGRLAPQDPTDEPAAKLLDRIEAERGGGTNVVRARRPRTGAPRAVPSGVQGELPL